MGGHTTNRLFGPTSNPYDVSKSAAGSSGGAGAAVAAGLIPFADGTDMMGSCRGPAAFATNPKIATLAEVKEMTLASIKKAR